MKKFIESHFKKISSAQFADILRKYVFNQMPVDNENAGLGAMDKMVTQIHNKHYQRSDELGKKKDSFGGVENVAKVIKTPDTHLQLNNGDYCEKEAFRNQFNQETWDELPEQLRAGDTLWYYSSRKKNEIKTDDFNLNDFYNQNGIDYDDEDFDDGEVHQEFDLKGFIGYKKVNSETLKLEFNDGEIIHVNVEPSKMASVIAKISNRDLRKTRVRVKCY